MKKSGLILTIPILITILIISFLLIPLGTTMLDFMRIFAIPANLLGLILLVFTLIVLVINISVLKSK